MALPKEQQSDQRKRSMKYLQGPNRSMREELVVAHEFLEAHPPDFYRFRCLSLSGSYNMDVTTFRMLS